ncbi:hypothetical protein C5167_007747 [Papaver somniferum]|nr:hypothetical protein C5167_007747 [Papaver somniferum]
MIFAIDGVINEKITIFRSEACTQKIPKLLFFDRFNQGCCWTKVVQLGMVKVCRHMEKRRNAEESEMGLG